MTAQHAGSAVLPPLYQLQAGVDESFGLGGAQYSRSHLLLAGGVKSAVAAADGQVLDADGQPGLRKGSDDSSRDLVTGLPQLGCFSAALAGKRLASQRSMQSLDDLSWARRPSGQDGSTLEVCSVGTFTRGLERIANQIPTSTHNPEEKDEYLMRLLGGPRPSRAATAFGGLPAAGGAAAPPQPPPSAAPSGSRLLSTSSVLHSTAAPCASVSQQQQSAASARAAQSVAASQDSPAARLAAHLAGPQPPHPQMPAQRLSAAAPAAAGAAAKSAVPARAQVEQRLGPAAFGRARAVLLAQQGEFTLQLYAMHAAARRQRQLLAACEEPELYQMALARVCAAAPPDAAKVLSPAAGLRGNTAAVAAADRDEASTRQQLQTPAPAARQRRREAQAEPSQQPQAQPAPSMHSQPQSLQLQPQQSCMQSQQAQPQAFSAAQQQAADPQSASGMYGPAASFDPMSAWYAAQLGGPGGQQPPFFGTAPPQLAMQQAALAQQQAYMQQQLAACQLQQQQLLCAASLQAPGSAPQQGLPPQPQLSVLYGQAAGLPATLPPGAGLAAGGGRPGAANGPAAAEPTKWWQDAQAAFGPAALPPGINSANAFYSGQGARGNAAEPQSAPPQPKATSTRPVRFAASGGKRSVPAAVAVPPKKRARSTTTNSSREEHIGQTSDPDRNAISASPRGVAANWASPPTAKTKRQTSLRRGASLAGRKRAAKSISSGCSKAGLNGGDNPDLDPESAAPPAALESAAGILLSFSGCG